MGHFRETILEIANTRAVVISAARRLQYGLPQSGAFARQVNPGDGDYVLEFWWTTVRTPAPHDHPSPRKGASMIPNAAGWVFLLEDGKITTDKKREGSSVLAFDEYKVRLPLDSPLQSLDLGMCGPARCHEQI